MSDEKVVQGEALAAHESMERKLAWLRLQGVVGIEALTVAAEALTELEARANGETRILNYVANRRARLILLVQQLNATK